MPAMPAGLTPPPSHTFTLLNPTIEENDPKSHRDRDDSCNTHNAP